MPQRWDILGIGAVAVDDLIYLDGFPAPEAKMVITEETRQGGGLAGTALVAAARLGVRVAYVGVLGEDQLSRYTLAQLEVEGVDCSLVRRSPSARPYHCTILVDRHTGGRTILVSKAGVIPPDSEDLSPVLIGAARMLFLDSTVMLPGLRAAMVANHLGVPVVADLERTGEGLPELLAHVDHLIVGTRFAEQVVGASHPAEMVRRLTHPGQAACVVTAGAEGCWYLMKNEGEVHHQPACRVPVVDTTGCGDVFHGAYAAAVVRGCCIASAIEIATVAAALKATQPGGRRGIPNWTAIERYMKENPWQFR